MSCNFKSVALTGRCRSAVVTFPEKRFGKVTTVTGEEYHFDLIAAAEGTLGASQRDGPVVVDTYR